MIKENYISFEQAKKLKKVGFPQVGCLNFYKKDGELFYAMITDMKAKYLSYNLTPDYAAPTLSLVAKWLREEKDIDINIECEKGNSYTDYKVYMPELTDYLVDEDDRPMLYETYEEALTAGINKALELIK